MEKTSLKSKNIILFFAWLSLIFGLISFSGTFIQCSWVSSSKTYLMKFVFPDILNLIFGIISIAYKVILVIYLTKWNLEKKNHLTFSVATGMIALDYFISLVYEIIDICYYFYYMYLTEEYCNEQKMDGCCDAAGADAVGVCAGLGGGTDRSRGFSRRA